MSSERVIAAKGQMAILMAGDIGPQGREGRGCMTNWDSQTFTNISADTEVFNLAGGEYGKSVVATWESSSVTLQILAADESTWLTAATPSTANGFETADLPPGQYRFHVASATAVYVAINGIPYD